MEKTIEIDGKKIGFKTNGATPLRYKAQFGKDYFKEIMKLAPLENLMGKKEDEINGRFERTWILKCFITFHGLWQKHPIRPFPNLWNGWINLKNSQLQKLFQNCKN